MQNKVLCILGMHRSGTSLLTNWLFECGLEVGNELLKGDFSNKKGHYEDLDFLQLHKDILKNNGVSETGLRLKEKPHINDYFKLKYKHLFLFKNELNYQWGWKEPRTILFLNECIDLFDGVNFVIIRRPDKEVINSLIRRDFKRIEHSFSNKNILNRLRFSLFRKHYYKQLEHRVKDIYTQSLAIYNKELQDFLNKTNKGVYCEFQLSELIEGGKDVEVFNTLKKWGFELTYKPFSDFFNSDLLSNKNHK